MPPHPHEDAVIPNKIGNVRRQGCGETENLGGNAEWCSYCGNQHGGSSKITHGITVQSSNFTSGYITQKNWKQRLEKTSVSPSLLQRCSLQPKRWRPPDCPSTGESMRKVRSTRTVEWYSAMEKGKIPTCSSTNVPGGCYAKWNMSDKKDSVVWLWIMCGIPKAKQMIKRN